MKKLLYVFGPDGAGKSTLVKGLADSAPNSVTINASRPELWPDNSWHQEITQRGIDRGTTDPAYHLQTLERCYAMAAKLLRGDDENPLIIDSDPRAQIAVKACALYDYPAPLPDLYAQLDNRANAHIPDGVQQLGVHVTVGQGTADQRAEVLVRRIEERPDNSVFDPDSVSQAQALVVAFDSLEAILTAQDRPVVRVETDRPYSTLALSGQVLRS